MIKEDGYIKDGESTKMLFSYSEEERQENEINRENAKLIFSPEFIPVYTDLLDKITITEALLFGFIKFYKTNSSGRMYFTNEQLATIIHCSPDTISRSMSRLENLGYIKTSRKIKAGGGQIRFINDIFYKPDSTFSTSQTMQKLQTNNNKIKDNNINNKYTFDDFYNLYNKKINKVGASKSWARLTSSEKDIVMATLPRYLSTIKDKQYQPHPQTYLNQRRWEDEIQVSGLDYTNTDNFLKDIDYKYNDIKARFKSKYGEEEGLKQFFAKKKEANLLAFKKI